MAITPLMGAGKSGNSNRENSPGASGMAKIIECDFHCSRSSIPSSLRTHIAPRLRIVRQLLAQLQKASSTQ